jgi:hypothetical protein
LQLALRRANACGLMLKRAPLFSLAVTAESLGRLRRQT